MPDIYYQHYTPVSAAIPDICAQEHALGRRLLLLGLSGLYGIHLSENELNQELKAAKNGKPWRPAFPGIHFNISHCDGLAVCAFDNTPVGVDVEMPGYFPEILIKKALAPEEKLLLESAGSIQELRQEWFFRFWTLKEAYVKQTGTGVDVPLTDFTFTFRKSEEGFAVLCSDSRICCFQKKLAGGHILSLCYEGNHKAITLLQL